MLNFDDVENINDLLREFYNCEDCDIVGNDIWINGPCSGHYLSAEEIEQFINWLDSFRN